jgi:ribonuclease VapC
LKHAWFSQAASIFRRLPHKIVFDDFLLQSEVAELAIDERVGRLAVECFERYGKGRHPAGLNFGDRLSYACAKAHGAALLFKGGDFARTDVEVR